MSRFLVRRFALIPVALLLVIVSGYAHAHLVLPIRAARIPYLSLLPDPGPLLPSYLDHSQTAIHLECGILPDREETITQIIVDASQAGAGLLALALTLSVIIGPSLGVETPGRRERWRRESSM